MSKDSISNQSPSLINSPKETKKSDDDDRVHPVLDRVKETHQSQSALLCPANLFCRHPTITREVR